MVLTVVYTLLNNLTTHSTVSSQLINLDFCSKLVVALLTKYPLLIDHLVNLSIQHSFLKIHSSNLIHLFIHLLSINTHIIGHLLLFIYTHYTHYTHYIKYKVTNKVIALQFNNRFKLKNYYKISNYLIFLCKIIKDID